MPPPPPLFCGFLAPLPPFAVFVPLPDVASASRPSKRSFWLPTVPLLGDVGIDQVTVGLHPLSPLGRVLARHHHVEGLAIGLEHAVLDFHREHPPGVGVQSGFPELLGTHLAEPLEAAHRPARLFHALVHELFLDRLELLLVQRVELARGLALALPRNVDPEERGLRDAHVSALDELREMAEEEREQQYL